MILVTDSETGKVLIDVEGDEGDNPDAIGTYFGPLNVNGPIYQGVRAWIAPATRTHEWEPEARHVFIQWTDKSSTKTDVDHERVHTVERPLPGGGVYRFVVVAD